MNPPDTADTARQLEGKRGRITIEGPIGELLPNGWLHIGESPNCAAIPLDNPDLTVTVEALPEPPPKWRPGMHLQLVTVTGNAHEIFVLLDPDELVVARVTGPLYGMPLSLESLDHWWAEGRLTFAPCTTVDGAR